MRDVHPHGMGIEDSSRRPVHVDVIVARSGAAAGVVEDVHLPGSVDGEIEIRAGGDERQRVLPRVPLPRRLPAAISERRVTPG